MGDPVEYLRAKLDERERESQDFHDRSADMYMDGDCVCDFPAWVLADIAAKRALLADLLAEPHFDCPGPEYACPNATDPETWAEVMGDAERRCTCGRDARVMRRVRLLAGTEGWRP